MKNLCSSKDTVKRVERQVRDICNMYNLQRAREEYTKNSYQPVKDRKMGYRPK